MGAPVFASATRFSSRPRSTRCPLTAPRASSSHPPATARSGVGGAPRPSGIAASAPGTSPRTQSCPRSSSLTPTIVVPQAAATRRTGVLAAERLGCSHQNVGSFRVSDISRMKLRWPSSPAANSARTRRRK